MRDGACVAKPEPRKPVGSGRELATGIVAAFVVALAAAVVFWLIGRMGRKTEQAGDGARAGGDGGSAGGDGVVREPAEGRSREQRGNASIV